ncbi:hypothetical protein [Streptomyces sudanensis]|uniref:hypothetical protein n=1 Tax=Streptomyces sudanensis TaxID=436397 RepID=UPI0020CCA72C|nr:hypothetical protein [Streptomyces sudanensis]MCP9957358.1 hypothetical protein [Streptomyces sudanensis]MCQ0002088.1 hypothetical protein [Streptomyces sudanensis]
MGSEGRRTVRRPQEAPAAEPACPSCGQPVGRAIHRRKVLGAWVPAWRPEPCRNPRCDLYEGPPHEAGGRWGNEPGGSGETG